MIRTKLKNLVYAVCFITIAGNPEAIAQAPDTLKESISVLEGKIAAMEERIAVNEGDLSKLTKIKVSGYIQAQFENYQMGLVKTNDPDNTFYIRRARVKFTYEATDGIKFVLQPDFSTGNLSLKDAYAVASLKTTSFTFIVGRTVQPSQL